jgi:predicted DsbA family dithiol-disulfide isomerase
MRVDIWSDVVCPWCYIGKRRFERALAAFDDRDDVDVVWHSFELDPSAPAVSPGPVAGMLAQKYGMTLAQAEAAGERVSALAAAEGLDYHLDITRPANTFDAHRLLHLAARDGRQGELKERLMRGYFTEGAAIGEPATLSRLAGEAGLDPAEAEAVLVGTDFTAEVRADEALAVEIGVTGVPFFVVDGRLAVSGAQPVEVFAQALADAASTRGAQPTHS